MFKLHPSALYLYYYWGCFVRRNTSFQWSLMWADHAGHAHKHFCSFSQGSSSITQLEDYNSVPMLDLEDQVFWRSSEFYCSITDSKHDADLYFIRPWRSGSLQGWRSCVPCGENSLMGDETWAGVSCSVHDPVTHNVWVWVRIPQD